MAAVLIIIIAIATFLIIKNNSDSFPVVEYGIGESLVNDYTYSVCEDAVTGERIYKSSWCGIDTCSVSFYNVEGDRIESVGHGSGATIFASEIETDVVECQYTTKAYFSSKVNN